MKIYEYDIVTSSGKMRASFPAEDNLHIYEARDLFLTWYNTKHQSTLGQMQIVKMYDSRKIEPELHYIDGGK